MPFLKARERMEAMGLTRTSGTVSQLNVSTITIKTSFNGGSNRLINVSTPTSSTDAATKGYVDTLGSGSTNYIQNGSTAQSATFNVSSGSVTNLTSSNLAVSSMTTALPMSNRLITGLASGVASSDGANYGQVQVIQTVYASVNASSTTTSTTFVPTNLTASITPTSASNRILVLVMGNLSLASTTLNIYAYTSIFRGSTDLSASSTGMQVCANDVSSGVSQLFCAMPMSILDSPSTTSSTTYTVKFKVTNALLTATWASGNGAATGANMILMEVR